MIAIIKREWRSLFHSMTAPVFIAVLIALTGIYFTAYNLTSGYPYFSYTLMSLAFILIVAVPILTMRSFSEDRRQKTDQILLTAPLRLSDIVLGKYLAMCGVMALTMLITCLCPLIIRSYGTAYLSVDYATIFCFFLLGCFFISVGMWISSMTESQVISAVCSFGVLLLIYLWGSLTSMLPTGSAGVAAVLFGVLTVLCIALWATTKNWLLAGGIELAGMIALTVIELAKPALLENFFTNYCSGFVVTDILENFAYYSLFDLAGVLKLLLAIGVMLFLTAQSIQKRRWS